MSLSLMLNLSFLWMLSINLVFNIVCCYGVDASVDGLYTFWKFGDSSFNYGMLPITQNLGYNICPNIAFNSETIHTVNNEFLQYSLITSDNHIMTTGYDSTTEQITMYIFDEDLHTISQQVILNDIEWYISSTSGPWPMYQEYNNRKYYVQHFPCTTAQNTELNHRLIVIEFTDNYQINILWEFQQTQSYRGFDTGDIYSAIMYKDYIYFQHATDSTGNYIKRYVFNSNDGSIIWNNTDTKNKYYYNPYTPPNIFEKNNVISIIFSNQYYQYSMDITTGKFIWFNDNTNAITTLYGGSSSVYYKYNLLFITCHINNTNHGVCVFDIINGDFITIFDIGNNGGTFVLNTRNGNNDFIVGAFNNLIYYNINVTVTNNGTKNVTFIENKIIDKEFRFNLYWIDSDSNIIASIFDKAIVEGCYDESVEYFIMTKAGIQSRNIYTCRLDGNYPIIPNNQQKHMYVTDHGDEFVAFELQTNISAATKECKNDDHEKQNINWKMIIVWIVIGIICGCGCLWIGVCAVFCKDCKRKKVMKPTKPLQIQSDAATYKTMGNHLKPLNTVV